MDVRECFFSGIFAGSLLYGSLTTDIIRRVQKVHLLDARTGKGMAEKQLLARAPDEKDEPVRFGDFVRLRYLPFVKGHKRSWQTDERHLKRHVLPYLDTCPLSEISAERLAGWLDELERAGLSRSSRYRLFWLTKYVLNCACRWGALSSDDAFRNVIVAREEKRSSPDSLSRAETRTLLSLLDEYADRPSAQAIRLMLLTGAGTSEILCARWENVHLNQRVLAASSTYTGRMRLIPLNTEAVRLIRGLPRRRDVPWLFASAGGQRITSVFYTWNLLRTRLRKPQLRIQDVRHGLAGARTDADLPGNNL